MSTSAGTINDPHAFNRLLDELLAVVEDGDLKLSILQNLTADERRTVLGQHIQAMSARTGMTHTRYIGWGIALENDERQIQAEAQGLLFKKLSID